jgi:hypothetical protein
VESPVKEKVRHRCSPEETQLDIIVEEVAAKDLKAKVDDEGMGRNDRETVERMEKKV